MSLPFSYRHGTLFCENVQISKNFEEQSLISWKAKWDDAEFIYDVPPTPAYVYSTASLRSNVQKYTKALEDANLNGNIGYAIKANPNLQIVQKLKTFGVKMIIAVSGYEVLAGIRAGFSPEMILLNGNGKQRWEIKLAIENGVMLNVDSVFDARQIAQVHASIKPEREIKLLLRIRPAKATCQDAKLKVHEYVNTAENSKFGFEMSELDQVLSELSNSESIKVIGVHCHFGSGIDTPKSYEWLGATLAAMTNELKSRGISPKIIDVGGGIGINYYDTPHGFMEAMDEMSRESYENLVSHPTKTEEWSLSQFMAALSSTIPSDMEVIVEPGRSLVGKSGILVCKSLGAKISNNRNILVVDGSMNEVIRPCLYKAHHQILPTEIKRTEKWEAYDVVGPICESADFLGRNVPLQNPTDYVAVMDCGAYCASMASTYNLKPRAAEILVDDNNCTFIRKRDSFNDITDKFYST